MEPDDLGRCLYHLLLRDCDGWGLQDRSNRVNDRWVPTDVCLHLAVAFNLAHVGSQAKASTSGGSTASCGSADYRRIATCGSWTDDLVTGSREIECKRGRLGSEH